MRKPVGPDSFYEMSGQKLFGYKSSRKGDFLGGPVVKTLCCAVWPKKKFIKYLYIYNKILYCIYKNTVLKKKITILRNTFWLDLKILMGLFTSSVYLVSLTHEGNRVILEKLQFLFKKKRKITNSGKLYSSSPLPSFPSFFLSNFPEYGLIQ